MVGDGEHRKPRHASGLQWASERASERAFSYDESQEERQQEQERQVQGR